jgi:cellulose synthase/poly-beta-1,6-N-acetylglucosamine synthase-like glycosyltransferase
MVLMEIIFWFSIGAIFYAYFGYPLVLMLMKHNYDDMVITDVVFEPGISIIIPAHNEERVIEEKIQNTLGLDYPRERIELILVSDGSSDRTEEIAKAYLDKGLKFYKLPERKGKAAALNLGLEKARNEIVVFSDSSIMLHSDALRRLVRRFAADDIGCVSGEDYIPGGGGEGAYGKYELFLRNLESRMGSIVGASGCFYAQRKNLCEPFPEGMAPDFFSVLKTIEKGFRAVTEPSAQGFMQSVPSHKGEFQRKIRTLLRGMTTLLYFKHLLNPFRHGLFAIQLISHKLIRWWVGIFLVLLLLSNVFLLPSKFYAMFFLLQIIFYTLALIGWMGLSGLFIFRIPLFFSMVNLSALIAWGKYFMGFRQEIWEPSRR